VIIALHLLNGGQRVTGFGGWGDLKAPGGSRSSWSRTIAATTRPHHHHQLPPSALCAGESETRSPKPRLGMPLLPNHRYFGLARHLPVRPSWNPSIIRPMRSDYAFDNNDDDADYGGCSAAGTRRKVAKGIEINQPLRDLRSTPFNFSRIPPLPFYADWKNKYFKTRHYGDNQPSAAILPRIEKWNIENPDKAIPISEVICDIIYCFSNGTVSELFENVPPYNNQLGDPRELCRLDPEEQETRPRFVLQVQAGYVAENGVKVGEYTNFTTPDKLYNVMNNRFQIPHKIRPAYVREDGFVLPF